MFSENLKKLRNAHGYTQQHLGEMLNLAHNTIATYEAGKRYPDLDVLTNMARIFCVSIDELLGLPTRNTDLGDYAEVFVAAKNKNISPEKLLELLKFLENNTKS